MRAVFPSAEWLAALSDKLNSDGGYGEMARHWEGDLLFDSLPEGSLQRRMGMYLDPWHGVCRGVDFAPDPARYPKPKLILRSPYGNFTAILLGKPDPTTAMMTSQAAGARAGQRRE